MEAYKSSKTIGALFHPGFYDQFVLIGFPYDEGARSSGLRAGAAYGPDCFRRFLHKLGPIHNAEFGADLSEITVCDYGNISASTMKERYEKLSNKIRLTMGRGQISFILGGSKDLIPFCIKGVTEYQPGLKMPELKEKTDSSTHKGIQPENLKLHKILILAITPFIDTDPNEISTSSKYIWRHTLEDPSFIKSGSKVVLFGVNSICDKNNYDYFISKGGSIIWLDEVRKQKVNANKFIQTQAGKVFEELINKQNVEYDHVYVSFDLESVMVIC